MTKSVERDLSTVVAKLLAPTLGVPRRGTLIEHKKVDLYFEYDSLGRRRRLFVETKDRDTPLRRVDVMNLWADFAGLIERLQPAELLVITRSGLTLDAETFIREMPFANHMTLDDLQLTAEPTAAGRKTPTDAPKDEPESKTVDSSTWTGRPTAIVTEAERIQALVILRKIERDMDDVPSNVQKAQAHAYVIALRALLEAPEPQTDLAWQIVDRANNLAGIGSLFVALLALFAAVSH